MKLRDFKVLSFDCYGTLIDWETGILGALKPLVQKAATPLQNDRILETFGRHESAQERATPAMRYDELLALVHSRIARDWGISTTREEDARFGASVSDWPAFPDSVTSLQYLKRHYRLAILSNVHRAGFTASNRRLGVEFDWIITAEDVGSYKPDRKNFDYLLSTLGNAGCRKADILHTAESLFHDHAPASAIGLASAWIHRRHAKEGHGATAAPAVMPHYDFRFTSLAEMVNAHKNEMS